MFKAATVRLKKRFSRHEGQRLGEELVHRLDQKPDACWLFCSARKDLEELVAGVHDGVATDNLIGCTTDGEVSNEGFSTGSAVLAGIVTDRIRFHLSVAGNLSQDSEEAGRKLARHLPESTRYIHLFSDGITGNGSAIVRGIASIFGDTTPVSGGTAGDNGRFKQTCQFAGREVVSDAAVALGFSGDFRVGIGVRSGWAPIGLAKTATRAFGNELFELNGEPALKVYERFLGKHARNLPAIGVEYPLGLVGAEGSIEGFDYFLLRATMAVNREKGSISFAGEIPEGAKVSLTCGDISSVLQASQEAAQIAISDLGDVGAVMCFCFSCMARKIVLSSRTQEEIELIRQTIGPHLPITGFYTYGEYAPVRCNGPNYLHNETLTVSAIGLGS